MFTVRTPHRDTTEESDVMASAFGLTSTESRVAVMMAAGRTVAEGWTSYPDSGRGAA